ncbi:MAG: sigma 54-interacting transcriptional regulator [Myxococcota bacterium]
MEGTVRTERFGVPVNTLSVEVVAGTDSGARVTGQEEITVGTASNNVLVLTDPTVSRYHLEIERQHDRVRIADLGTTNGTVVGPALVKNGTVAAAVGAKLSVGNTVLQITEGQPATVDLRHRSTYHGIVGSTPAMQHLMDNIERLGDSPASVLILGETGTGKELVARAIHEASARAEGPFVTVDCGAIPTSLFASELFGHERGAFTGADRSYPGAIERAHGGTLFLDEIGELPRDQQPALLGSLERRRVRRVGGRAEIDVDVRVVCATHRDLRAEVNAGTFRQDLYYRLAVVLLRIPALRERGDDIPELIQHFLRESQDERGLEALFEPRALREMMKYRWPGNVRELRNVVSAAQAMGGAPELDPSPIAAVGAGDTIEAVLSLPYKSARRTLLDHFEERYVRRILEASGGNVRKAARDAGMDRSYLNDLIKRHGLR